MSEPPPNAVPIAPGLHVPESMLQFTYARSSGPGGQNVNKLNTKAILTVALDDLLPLLGPAATDRLVALAGTSVTDDGRLILSCDEHRSQVANRKTCLDKLRALIIQARVRPKRRRKTKPTRGSKERRLKEKKRRSEIKQQRRTDF